MFDTLDILNLHIEYGNLIFYHGCHALSGRQKW